MSNTNFMALVEGLQKSSKQDVNTKAIGELLGYGETQIKKAKREIKEGMWNAPTRFDRAVLFALMLGEQNGFESLHVFISMLSGGCENKSGTTTADQSIEAQIDLIDAIDEGAGNADQTTGKTTTKKAKPPYKTIRIGDIDYPDFVPAEIVEQLKTIAPDPEEIDIALEYAVMSPKVMIRCLKAVIRKAAK